MTFEQAAVRPAGPNDRAEIDKIFVDSWGEPRVAGGGRLHELSTLPTLVAIDIGATVVGVLTYDVAGDNMEIVSIDTTRRSAGIGTALLDAAAQFGTTHGLGTLWLVTTNDNLDALRFYQRRGLRILGVRPGAAATARALKPSIPIIGDYGIPIRDEIVLSRSLSSGAEL